MHQAHARVRFFMSTRREKRQTGGTKRAILVNKVGQMDPFPTAVGYNNAQKSNFFNNNKNNQNNNNKILNGQASHEGPM